MNESIRRKWYHDDAGQCQGISYPTQNAEPMYLFPYLPFEAHETGIEHDWQDEMGKNDS